MQVSNIIKPLDAEVMDYLNNADLQVIVKTLIHHPGPVSEKFQAVLNDPRFKNKSRDELIDKVRLVNQTLNARIHKQTLSIEEQLFVLHYTLNNVQENGCINKKELLKSLKAQLFIQSTLLDAQISGIMERVAEKRINPVSFGIPSYLLPKRKDSTLLEKKDGWIIAEGDKFLDINSHILFFEDRKIFGLGLVNTIEKEKIIKNIYKILPILVITNDNLVHHTELDRVEYMVKNVPFCSITPHDSQEIFNRLTKVTDKIILGGRLAGNKLMKANEHKILWYELSHHSLLDMFERRMVIMGPPSAGKSILAVQILRHLASRARKVISIAPRNPNIAKFGFPLVDIGPNNPSWNLEQIGSQYMELCADGQLQDYDFIVLGEQNLMPDVEKLSKQTILSLINDITDSVQMKNMIALELVDKSIMQVLLLAEKEALVDPGDFQQNQIKALKRLAKILLKWQEIGTKIDLKDVIFNQGLSLGIHIDSELFLPELTYILLSEIYSNATPCFNIKQDGFVLMVDELPYLATVEGVMVKGIHLGRLFNQINKQGRNLGILLSGIIQDYNKKIENQFLPVSLDEYCVFELMVRDNKRIVLLNNELVLIPPVSNQ